MEQRPRWESGVFGGGVGTPTRQTKVTTTVVIEFPTGGYEGPHVSLDGTAMCVSGEALSYIRAPNHQVHVKAGLISVLASDRTEREIPIGRILCARMRPVTVVREFSLDGRLIRLTVLPSDSEGAVAMYLISFDGFTKEGLQQFGRFSITCYGRGTSSIGVLWACLVQWFAKPVEISEKNEFVRDSTSPYGVIPFP